MGLAEGTEQVSVTQAGTWASATAARTDRNMAVMCCVVMTTLILFSLYLCYLACQKQFHKSTEGSKQRMLGGELGKGGNACAKNFVTFVLPWQPPQPIIDTRSNVPSINNNGLFMNLAKCFMNQFLFLTLSPQDSSIIFW